MSAYVPVISVSAAVPVSACVFAGAGRGANLGVTGELVAAGSLWLLNHCLATAFEAAGQKMTLTVASTAVSPRRNWSRSLAVYASNRCCEAISQ
jgi:hypothetical protein